LLLIVWAATEPHSTRAFVLIEELPHAHTAQARSMIMDVIASVRADATTPLIVICSNDPSE
jgi:hypothetical protein